MTEVGEVVSPGMVDQDEENCPFEHDLEDPPDVKNDLKGIGSTLASRMKAQKGTHLYKKIMSDYLPTEKILNPKSDPDHILKYKTKVVKIDCYEKMSDEEGGSKRRKIAYKYPVTCAAHHCIPAQESLKGHQLLAFMCKKGTSDDFNHSYSGGRVWSNVGYDVNGSQNGVYLPGSYAVGGGRGGMKVWTKDMPDKENEDETEPEAENSNLLDGELNEISNSNRKWLYVKQATGFAKGQFHDRHADYSKEFIQGILTKIFADYLNRVNGSFWGNDCAKCKKRVEKAKELGVPTAYGLVARLNKVSDKCKIYLTGISWPINVYTSKWGKAFMEEKLKGNPDAD